MVNGYDGTAEELYFTSGAAALARGYNVLTFDGPGQGTAIIEDGLPFRPDAEAVITQVVDLALRQPGTDPDRIALMGNAAGRQEIRDGRPVFEMQMLELGAIALDGTAPTALIADQLLAVVTVT